MVPHVLALSFEPKNAVCGAVRVGGTCDTVRRGGHLWYRARAALHHGGMVQGNGTEISSALRPEARCVQGDGLFDLVYPIRILRARVGVSLNGGADSKYEYPSSICSRVPKTRCSRDLICKSDR